jgi:hypothetical protein
VREVVTPGREVVLVAAVAVAGRVGVVLEQVDDAADALFAQSGLSRHEQLLEDALARLVVGDEVEDRVALRGGVLGMAADVEVEAGAVGEEHVGGPAPRHDAPEQVAGHLVGAETPLTAERAGDAVLVLETEDAPLHGRSPSLRPLGGPDGGSCPHATAVRVRGRRLTREYRRTWRAVQDGAHGERSVARAR